MAKRSTNKTSKRTSSPSGNKTQAGTFPMGGEREYKEILKEFLTSPAVKYIAAGISTALLARFANRVSEKYPEMSHFIRENMETLEGKLDQLKENLQAGDISQRH